jgi:hypothetical protein
MALFGNERAEPFNKLNLVIKDIFIAARSLGNDYWPHKGRAQFDEKQYERFINKMFEYEDMLWESSEDDKIAKRVNEIVNEIESVCKKALQVK